VFYFVAQLFFRFCQSFRFKDRASPHCIIHFFWFFTSCLTLPESLRRISKPCQIQHSRNFTASNSFFAKFQPFFRTLWEFRFRVNQFHFCILSKISWFVNPIRTLLVYLPLEGR